MEKPGKSAAYNSELESKSAKENVTSDAAAGASFTRLRGFDTSISPPSLFKTHQPFPSRRVCLNQEPSIVPQSSAVFGRTLVNGPLNPLATDRRSARTRPRTGSPSHLPSPRRKRKRARAKRPACAQKHAKRHKRVSPRTHAPSREVVWFSAIWASLAQLLRAIV